MHDFEHQIRLFSARKCVKEKEGKKLYDYQKNDLDEIFRKINEHPDNYNFLYQLPTGGGKPLFF